ncbi:MAG: DUF4258 domain-containing protein [Prochlorotrichaceae cyanobacterium]|jgi:hypothetical protein
MKIHWTKHAEERQEQWQQRFQITREEVENVLTAPEQVVPEGEALVAQSKRGEGLLRVVYVEIAQTQRILTVYWTNQVKRYWREERDEN